MAACQTWADNPSAGPSPKDWPEIVGLGEEETKMKCHISCHQVEDTCCQNGSFQSVLTMVMWLRVSPGFIAKFLSIFVALHSGSFQLSPDPCGRDRTQPQILQPRHVLCC